MGTFLDTLAAMVGVTIAFLVILLVVMLPSGISQQALLFPKRLDLGKTFKDTFFYDYYRLFGEFNIEATHGKLDNSTDKQSCSQL